MDPMVWAGMFRNIGWLLGKLNGGGIEGLWWDVRVYSGLAGIFLGWSGVLGKACLWCMVCILGFMGRLRRGAVYEGGVNMPA